MTSGNTTNGSGHATGFRALQSSQISNSRSRTLNLTMTYDAYAWLAMPVRFGEASFSTSLGTGGMFTENYSISTDNGNGYTEAYMIYRSNQAFTADASNPYSLTVFVS